MLDKLSNRLQNSQDAIRNESSRKYMDYGLSGVKEKKEKDDLSDDITSKIKASEDKIDMLLGIIENLATDKDNKKDKKIKHNQNNKNNRKKLFEKSKRDEILEKMSLHNRKVSENKKGENMESLLKTEAYPASSYQNISTRLSTHATNITPLANIKNLYSNASSLNNKANNILTKSLSYSASTRSNMRKGTNISNIALPINILASPPNKKESEIKKLKFNLNLNIDLSNSDKQDLINIITDENINNFTSNIAANSNIKSRDNSIANNINGLIDKSEKSINGNSNKNNNKNSNLFLTKINENHSNNTKYSRFNINNANKSSDGNLLESSDNLNKELLKQDNFNNNKEKEKLIHDFSMFNMNNNYKEKENSIFSGCNPINLISPKNIVDVNYYTNQIQDKKLINNTFTEKSEGENIKQDKNLLKPDLTNLISRLETNPNEKSTQSRTRIKGCLSPISNSIVNKNNYNYSYNLSNNSSGNKSNLIGKNLLRNSLIKENYDGESELSSPKRSKRKNKSYFDILDLISKDYNLTEVNVPSSTKHKSKKDSENLKKKNHINCNFISNANNDNSDLNIVAKLKANSENNINSTISSEEILSSHKNKNINYNFNINNNLEKFDLQEKDSFENYLNLKNLRGAKSAKKQDLHCKSKEFLDKFIFKCNSQQNNLEKQMNKIKSELKKRIKTDNTDINRVSTINQINREIDKKVFLMDNKEINRDKVLLLLASEGKDGKKQIFIENRSSPLFVGELISNINDQFAYKCRNFLLDKFDNPLDKEKRQMHQYKSFQEYLDNQARLNVHHKKVDNILFNIEATKNNSIRRINSLIAKNNNLKQEVAEES